MIFFSNIAKNNGYQYQSYPWVNCIIFSYLFQNSNRTQSVQKQMWFFNQIFFLKKLCQQRIERHVCQILFWKKGSFSNPLLLLVHSSKFQGVLHKNFKLKILFYFYRSENPKLIFYFSPHPPILMSLKIKNGKSNFEYSYKDFSRNFSENTKSEIGEVSGTRSKHFVDDALFKCWNMTSLNCRQA